MFPSCFFIMRIKLLLPNSIIYPLLGKDIVQGFRYGLQKFLPAAEVNAESIGNGIDAKAILTTVQNSALNDDFDLYVSYLNPDTYEQLVPFFNSQNIPYINLDSGARNKGIANNISLQLCKASYNLALARANESGNKPKVLFLNSFYNSGYQFSYNFQKGFEETVKDSTFLFKVITQEPNWDEIFKSIKEEKPDAIYFSLSSIDESQKLFEFLATEKLTDKIKLFTDSLTLALFTSQTVDDIIKVTTLDNWYPDSEWPGSNFFTEYKNDKGKPISYMGILGYEAAIYAAEILQGKNEEEALSNLYRQSPRSYVTDNDGTIQPEYRTIEAIFTEGRVKYKFGKPFTAKSLTLDNGLSGGWLNPYLSSE